MTYAEKLKDPRWQKRRLKVMEYAHWRCQICGASNNTLHCHHSYYTKGKEPWQYPDGSIICICDACHEKIHGRREPRRPAVESKSDGPPVGKDRARGIFADLRKKLMEMQ